jgi:hypothetical protein
VSDRTDPATDVGSLPGTKNINIFENQEPKGYHELLKFVKQELNPEPVTKPGRSCLIPGLTRIFWAVPISSY